MHEAVFGYLNSLFSLSGTPAPTRYLNHQIRCVVIPPTALMYGINCSIGTRASLSNTAACLAFSSLSRTHITLESSRRHRRPASFRHINAITYRCPCTGPVHRQKLLRVRVKLQLPLPSLDASTSLPLLPSSTGISPSARVKPRRPARQKRAFRVSACSGIYVQVVLALVLIVNRGSSDTPDPPPASPQSASPLIERLPERRLSSHSETPSSTADHRKHSRISDNSSSTARIITSPA